MSTEYWETKHDEDFANNCHSIGHHIAKKGSLLLICCIDGSDQSDEAFRSALNMRGKYDHLCVFHAYRGDKPDLQPASWRPKQLESKYDCELIGHIPARLHSLIFKDRVGQPVLEVLKSTLASSYTESSELPMSPDLVIMGHHGRKGPKAERTTLGSTTDQALRSLPYPCLVVKSSIRKGPKKVVMAVNASEVSKRGLDILLQFVNPRDTLILVHLLPDGASGTSYMKMQEYYSEELENYGPADSKFMFLERDRSIPVTHAITEFCNDMADLDLFAIAPRAKQDRSSVTDYIVNYVQCSVLLCKV